MRFKHLLVRSLLLISLLSSNSAWSATITVTTTSDDALSTTTTNGSCSLREAIINANNNARTYADCTAGASGSDVISLTGGQTYTLTIPNPGAVVTNSGTDEDNSATGDLDIKNGLTISASGDTPAIINGGGSTGTLFDRIFEITGAYDLTLTNCTVEGGYLVATSGDVYGGGIYLSASYSTLTLTDSTVSGNTAISSAAGAALNTDRVAG